VQTLPDEIETERLTLRRPRHSDAKAIFASYAQDPAVCRFMVWTPHASEAVTAEFIGSCVSAWNEGTRFAYILVASGSDSPVGMLEARPQGSTIDIGYVLAATHWGKGLMTEAIDALVATALAQPSTFRIQASCDVENIRSQRALEKSGFHREGRLERYTIHPTISPEPRACFMYARFR
jgi:ribosomal-protein-alanine N-acetyltransferase